MTDNVTELKSPLVGVGPMFTQVVETYRRGGLPRGHSTGWKCVDELYTVETGQWTVVTGIPGSGKSEWLDALMINLAERADWAFAIYSPENHPVSTHMIKLIEKRVRKPFGKGVTPRMSEQEARDAFMWIGRRMKWLDPKHKTPDDLINAALDFRPGPVERPFGIVLDPWNTLEHQRGSMSETDYVSFILTEVQKLARESSAHVWLVVHPAKIQRNRDGTRPVPSPYDLSGSAHWYNKADNIITVHRDQADGSQDVEIHVQKVRFKHVGHVGGTMLKYDKITGRYFEHQGPTIDGEQYADPERGQTPQFDFEAYAERMALQSSD